MKIYKKIRFHSAHQLDGHPTCGKLHGHSYVAEVWIKGIPQGKHKFVIDFGKIKDYFGKLDHSGTPIKDSAEVMARKAVEHFIHFENVNQVKVRIWETPTAYAEEILNVSKEESIEPVLPSKSPGTIIEKGCGS